jgi:hypothetical protein
MSKTDQFPVCRDYHKDVIGEHPTELYHGTSDIVGVCKDGLLPREELPCISGRCGLGGGVSDLISFTSDKDTAFVIADEIENLMRIARGTYTWDNIKEKRIQRDTLYKKDASSKARRKEMEKTTKNGTWLWEKLIEKAKDDDEKFILSPKRLPSDEVWEDFKDGWYTTGNLWKKGKSLEEFEREESIRHSNDLGGDADIECRPFPYFTDNPIGKAFKKMQDEGKHAQVQCYDPERIRFHLFNFYKNHYLWEREQYGGKENPLFVGNTYRNFKHGDPDKVGVVKVTGHLPRPLETWERMTRYNLEANSDADFRWKHPDYYELYEKYSLNGKDGFQACRSMGEYRLSRDRFNKLEIIEAHKHIFESD